jgi:hypothetical protein
MKKQLPHEQESAFFSLEICGYPEGVEWTFACPTSRVDVCPQAIEPLTGATANHIIALFERWNDYTRAARPPLG